MKEVVRRVQRFVLELKRRKVFRVALMYGVVAWLLIQIAETTFPALAFPEWTIRFVIVAALLGFPLALVLSWAYDLQPESPAPTAAVPPPIPPPTHAHAGTAAAAELEPPISPPVPSYRLPVPPTPFVGREREMAAFQLLLADPMCRVVTVCGPGGVGKTRFALEVAARGAGRFENGAAFVPLNALADARPLLATVAERLGLPLSGRGDARRELFDFLAAKSLLLVMDNFEHLTESAGLVGEMLENAPGLKVLVTSRERLGLYGEALFPLEGLALAEGGVEPGDVARSEAVHLFLQSATRAHLGFRPGEADLGRITEICAAVGGLPLAIELAAAWVRVLSCEEILREVLGNRDFLADSLRDVPERHRSVRSVFESSWRMLSDAERRAYRRLAVFRGGCDASAAEAVAGSGMPMLSALLDKSLVRRGAGGRFEVLEVLRQYGEEKLREDADEFTWVRRHHCDHYVGVLDALGRQLGTPGEKQALDLIGEEAQNVRGAWQWAAEHRLFEHVERAMHCVFVFHEARGRAHEGWELFRDAAVALGEVGDTAAERLAVLRLRVREAIFSGQIGRAAEAGYQLDAAIAALRGVDAPSELAFALDRRGVLAYEAGGYPETERFCGESLALARGVGDGRLAGWALMHLGNAAFASGDYARSEQLHREALAELDTVGDRRGVANCHRNLGVVAGVQEMHDESRRAFELALAISRESDSAKGVCLSLQNLGTIAWMVGDHRQAEIYLREAVDLCRELGLRQLLAFSLNVLGRVEEARGRHAEAWECLQQALAIASELENTPLVLEVLVGAARSVGLHGGQPDRARRLLALVLDNPASDHDTREGATHLLAELDSLSSPDPDQVPDWEARLPLDAVVAGILRDGTAAAPGRAGR